MCNTAISVIILSSIITTYQLRNRSFRLRVVSLTATQALTSHIDVSLKKYIATDCNKGYHTTAKLLLHKRVKTLTISRPPSVSQE